jgi:hypothetical protein
MHNHHEKARDMARSVLPSTARGWSHAERARIHRSERARSRAQLRALRQLEDPDDYEGDLTWASKHEIAYMVSERRAADKIGPLTAWATRTVDKNPELATAPLEVRLDYFRRLLPPGVIGEHAISHLRYPLDPAWRRHRYRPGPSPSPTLSDMVEAIVAAGAHGELNYRIGRAIAPFVRTAVTVPPTRLINDDHPAPGILIPRHVEYTVRRQSRRFLAGAHDINGFASQTPVVGRDIARYLYVELVNAGQVS